MRGSQVPFQADAKLLSSVQRHLDQDEQQLVERYRSGQLLREANAAIIAYGHGTLLDETRSRIALGDSSGGFSRRFLDDWHPPTDADLEPFARQRRVVVEDEDL